MKAIIVDDEPKAISLLENYLEHFSAISVEATFRNGLKAFEFLNKEKIDLVFLDINMPHLSGISLSKMISPPTKIIFTTAYSEFAAESYEVEAFDYLLKPISFERFAKSISKVLNKNTIPQAKETESILVKSGIYTHQIQTADIGYLEKEGNYLNYHLTDQKILARETIPKALEALPAHFLQVHKSYIVNTLKIDRFNKEQINIGDKVIPIGASFKEHFLALMQD